MKYDAVRVAVVAAAGLLGATAAAQQTAKIDFESVGRAAPLLVDINQQDIVGAAIRRSFGQQRPAADEGAFIGSARRRASARYRAAAGRHLHIEGFLPGPRALERLPRVVRIRRSEVTH